MKILGKFIHDRGSAKRNQTWAFLHLTQQLHHITETHNLNTQISIQQGETHNDIQDLSFQPHVRNGVIEAIPNSDNQYTLEAIQIWSMAKQLGLTRGGNKEAIIKKFQQMEERDMVEANRRVDSNRNQ